MANGTARGLQSLKHAALVLNAAETSTHMAKKNGRNRDEYDENERLGDMAGADNRSDASFGWQLPETQLKATALVDEMLRNASNMDSRTRQYLLVAAPSVGSGRAANGRSRQSARRV
jgi:hypothetical protein